MGGFIDQFLEGGRGLECVVGVSDLTGPYFWTHFTDGESVAVSYVVCVGHVFFEGGTGV